MSTKNLGQVASLYIGSSAPVNTSLIWYDNTPSIRTHKVYDFNADAWVVLDKNAISAITYSELRNLASGTGLTQGSWYKITDRGNILALAITTTKVQYTDIINNFIIDDLDSNATYVVTSSNLIIDDIHGVWDANNNKLIFSFEDTVQDDDTADDYIFGKKQRNSIWSLSKYKLSSLISSVTGNSITWNRGLFFNFRKNLQENTNVSGGVVGKDAYDIDKAVLQQSINNIAETNQTILNTTKNYTDEKVVEAKNYTDEKVTDYEIYRKKLPSAPTAGTAVDISMGDQLSAIIEKIQRWINKFKIATGVNVSNDFSYSVRKEFINNGDNVDSALRKVQGCLSDIYNNGIYFYIWRIISPQSGSNYTLTNKNNTIISCYNNNGPININVGTLYIGRIIIIIKFYNENVNIISPNVKLFYKGALNDSITLDEFGQMVVMFYDGSYIFCKSV